MKERIWEYVVSLYKDISSEVYIGLALVLCVGVVLLMVAYGFRKGTRLSAGLLLAEYVFLLYSSTVIFRATSEQFSGYDYHPFWSYRAIQSGEKPQLLVENIMNVVAFVSVGFLLGAAFQSMTWKRVLSIGCGLSVGIEVIQLMLKRGFCEVDDVMHNTAGCVIGYGMFLMARGALHKIWR